MYQKSLGQNYAKDCADPHIFVSRKHLLLLLNLLHHHHELLPPADILFIISDQRSPWDVADVIVSLTSNGTANCMFVHCADKDSQDMLKRIVLTVTTMMELEDISIQKELKPVTIAENVKTPMTFTYLFWNQIVQSCNFFLPLSPISFCHFNMFPISFTQMFEFIAPASILKLAITPTFKQFYPPPILTKHPILYPLDTNFFITSRGTLHDLHWRHFQNSILVQEIVTYGEKHLIGLCPQHPIPFNATSLITSLSSYIMVPSNSTI